MMAHNAAVCLLSSMSALVLLVLLFWKGVDDLWPWRIPVQILAGFVSAVLVFCSPCLFLVPASECHTHMHARTLAHTRMRTHTHTQRERETHKTHRNTQETHTHALKHTHTPHTPPPTHSSPQLPLSVRFLRVSRGLVPPSRALPQDRQAASWITVATGAVTCILLGVV